MKPAFCKARLYHLADIAMEDGLSKSATARVASRAFEKCDCRPRIIVARLNMSKSISACRRGRHDGKRPSAGRRGAVGIFRHIVKWRMGFHCSIIKISGGDALKNIANFLKSTSDERYADGAEIAGAADITNAEIARFQADFATGRCGVGNGRYRGCPRH